MKDKIGLEVRKTIIVQSERLGCENVELNVQVDHVHFLIRAPPKVSISSLMGVMKGKSAIRVFSKFPELKQRAAKNIKNVADDDLLKFIEDRDYSMP